MLVAVLLTDPSSFLQAAVNKWKHPVSREWVVLAHVYDLLATVNSKKKPTPYPVPWLAEGVSQMGSTKQSNDVVRRHLDTMNPKE